MATPMTIEETARRVARYGWLATRCFEVLGGWVVQVPEPEVRLVLSAQSGHFGWHRSVWADREPGHYGIGGGGSDPPPPLVELFDSLGAGASTTVERLAAAHRVVLPRLVAAHAAHLERASPVADGAVARALRLVVADEAEDWREGERLLQSLLVDGAAVDLAAAATARAERLVVAGGGLLGGLA